MLKKEGKEREKERRREGGRERGREKKEKERGGREEERKEIKEGRKEKEEGERKEAKKKKGKRKEGRREEERRDGREEGKKEMQEENRTEGLCSPGHPATTEERIAHRGCWSESRAPRGLGGAWGQVRGLSHRLVTPLSWCRRSSPAGSSPKTHRRAPSLPGFPASASRRWEAGLSQHSQL